MLTFRRLFILFTLSTIHCLSAMEKDEQKNKKRKVEESVTKENTQENPSKKQKSKLDPFLQKIKTKFEEDKKTYQLHLAALEGDLKTIKEIFNNNHEFFIQEINGTVLELFVTPLFCAVAGKNPECVEFLLEKDAKTDSILQNGYTIMHVAALYNSIKAAELLHHKNSELINAVTADDDSTPLHCAAEKNAKKIITWLLEKGTNSKVINKYGNTVLHITALFGSLEAAQLIYKKNPELINTVNPVNGFTVLHCAAQENKPELITWLLDNGADSNALDMQGNNAMHIAAYHGSLQAAQVLYDKNKDLINTANAQDGWTPLHCATQDNHVKFLVWLLKNHTDSTATDTHGFNAMLIAACYGSLQAAQILHEKNPKLINMTNPQDGATPLHCAAYNNKQEFIRWLLDNGSPINSINKNGFNALYFALRNNSLESVQLLITFFDKAIEMLLSNKHSTAAHQLKRSILSLHEPQGNEVESLFPLHMIVQANSEKILEWLLAQNVHLDVRSQPGNQTVLHLAAQKNQLTLIPCILNWIRSPKNIHVLLNWLPDTFKCTPASPLSIKQEMKRALLFLFILKKRVKHTHPFYLHTPLIKLIVQFFYNPEEFISYLFNLLNNDDKTPLQLATTDECKKLLMLEKKK